MVRGVFITFEGCEGTGKSTQVRMLTETLEAAGLTVTTLREPGATRVGEAIRKILLDPAHTDLDDRAELLLYEASRAQLLSKVIAPTLASGGVVVCDRYVDSTTAYQGYGRGIPLTEVITLNSFATAGVTPDITVLLDLDPVEGLKRATCLGVDRLEGEDPAFYERVREGFLAIAEKEPERIVVVDAIGTLEEVAARVRDAVLRVPVLAAVLDEGISE